jgi:hypothetical protein
LARLERFLVVRAEALTGDAASGVLVERRS